MVLSDENLDEKRSFLDIDMSTDVDHLRPTRVHAKSTSKIEKFEKKLLGPRLTLRNYMFLNPVI